MKKKILSLVKMQRNDGAEISKIIVFKMFLLEWARSFTIKYNKNITYISVFNWSFDS